jgi:hypothetical protein
MLINRQLVNPKDFDFIPDVNTKFFKKRYYHSVEYHCSSILRFSAFLVKKARKAPLELSDFHLLVYRLLRTKILPYLFSGSSGDTGYKIYKNYRSFIKYYTLQVFVDDRRSSFRKWVDFFLPRFFSPFPRKAFWITNTSSTLFKDFGENGHQFFFQGELLAFHILRSRYSEEDKVSIEKRLMKKAEEFLSLIFGDEHVTYIRSD